jgi:quercetin dioxygenase-like cupin family protein
MSKKAYIAGIIAGALAFGGGIALGQSTAPPGTTNATFATLAKVDLAKEIPGMDGRELRMRFATVQPGGIIGLHSHADRPAVVYMLQGTMTQFQSDGSVRIYRAGDAFQDGNGDAHWVENKGTTPMTFITVDIFHHPAPVEQSADR